MGELTGAAGSGLQLVGRHAGLGGVFRGALRLDFGGMEDAVGAEAAIGQRLRSVAERVRQRVPAFVGNSKHLFILYEIEFHHARFVDYGTARPRRRRRARDGSAPHRPSDGVRRSSCKRFELAVPPIQAKTSGNLPTMSAIRTANFPYFCIPPL